jgi:predicted AlkP superfamily pyrophosphatase or phosphodiesterase
MNAVKYCFFYLLSFFVLLSGIHAQTLERPKLIVGLVIDQMRWDYLYRFQDLYGSGGFNRLREEGFNCAQTMIPFIPTYTAAGHACIYSGSVPAINGIIGNNWYERSEQKVVYCTDDATVKPLGTPANSGLMSPRRMLVTTIGDELHLAENFRGKIIGISLKDRASILPAGHSADAAYWMDEKTGNWISSTYYMNQLPSWVVNINDQHPADKMMTRPWELLLPASKYEASTVDDMPFEENIPGEQQPVFPHRISLTDSNRYLAFKFTPDGATHTFNFAKQAIASERLGRGKATDMLALSISSTDYIGHTFGPNSLEAEDAFIRLDRDIASFLSYLDSAVGKGQYLLFLSADHGVAQVPAFNRAHNIPAGLANEAAMLSEINAVCLRQYGISNIVFNDENHQFYLRRDFIEAKHLNRDSVEAFISDKLLERPEVAFAFPLKKLANYTMPEPIASVIRNSYNPSRSGDIQIILKPNYFNGGSKGTTHGAWNPYDAHIPLIWYGWKVKPGSLQRKTYMTDIAATLAAMLHIQMPNGCVGHVIEEVLK